MEQHKKTTFHYGAWTMDIIEFEDSFDVQVWPDPEHPRSSDWIYASVGWSDFLRAREKGELWIELKEAEEKFRNHN